MANITAENSGGITAPIGVSEALDGAIGTASRELVSWKAGAYGLMLATSAYAFGMQPGGPTENVIEHSGAEEAIQDFCKHPLPITLITGASSEIASRLGFSERRSQFIGLGTAGLLGWGAEIVGAAVENKGMSFGPVLDVLRSQDYRATDVVFNFAVAGLASVFTPFTRKKKS